MGFAGPGAAPRGKKTPDHWLQRERVDPLPQDRQQRGQDGERGEHGDQDGANGAQAHAAQEALREEEQTQQADADGQAGK